MYDASVFDVPPLSMDGRVRQDLLLMAALFGRCDWSVVGALEIPRLLVVYHGSRKC